VTGSKLSVWWKCSVCGGKYKARVSNRAILHRGCPYCAGKQVLKGYNDLKTIRPDIALEWHPTKNLGLKPTEITAGSNKRVWWKCSICDNEWETSVTQRVSGSNCPLCGTRKSAKAKHKPVLCVETGMSFESCKNAGQHYNIKNPSSSVASAARTGRKTGGYHWQFIDENTILKI
jgi:DNA-directed RNA polymerase subunit RPC12/RpoP